MKLIVEIPDEKYKSIMERIKLDRNFRECNITELPSIQSKPKTDVLAEIRAEINSPNRGTCDYFIVDRIEEIIDKYTAESKE